MYKKIIATLFFTILSIAFLLPFKALAAEPTVTAKDDTVTITIPCGSPSCAIPPSGYEIKKDGAGGRYTGTDDGKGNVVITDTPGAGNHIYEITIGSTTYSKSVFVAGSGGLIPDMPENQTLDHVKLLIARIGNLALTIVGGIAVIYIIIGAYYYFFAFGNEERATTAKKTITYAVVGVIVIILAKFILAQVWLFASGTNIGFLF